MKKRRIYYALAAVSAALWITEGCANRGIGPQGGPIDSLPPVLVRATPPNGTLDYKGKTVEFVFDEYITLENPSENILVSPPQQHPAEIRSAGKKVRIEFQEDLADSTTYTIDFGTAIQDNNEKNKLEGFTYSFTTAGDIDSLEIYGQLVNAENLNPISGIVVGFYANRADSMFEKHPFTRIGRTNAEGEFSVKNIHAGTYRLFALDDASRDYCYQPGEGLAFYEEPVTPYIDIKVETDTIWRTDTVAADSSLIPDSVITAEYYYFEPSDILLKFFKEDKQRHYFQRAFREKQHFFRLFFSAPQDELPTLRALRPESDSAGIDTAWVDFLDYALCQPSINRDTITYWLTDSAAIRMDTLRFEMTYLKSDSLYNLQPQTDTILAVYKAPRSSAKALALQQQKQAEERLQITSNASSKFQVYDTLGITSPTPVASLVADSIHLKQHVDTLWKDVPFRIDTATMGFRLICTLNAGCEYKLTTDSAAVFDIYGKCCDRNEWKINVRPMEDYATLTVHLTDYTPQAYIQLLNESDQPVRQMQARPEGNKFTFLEGKPYYMRLFIDWNGDGKWTTGDWLKKRQPEPVYYFHKRLNLRANWEFEETFDWKGIPLLEQKPQSIRKDEKGNKK